MHTHTHTQKTIKKPWKYEEKKEMLGFQFQKKQPPKKTENQGARMRWNRTNRHEETHKNQPNNQPNKQTDSENKEERGTLGWNSGFLSFFLSVYF